MKISLNTVIVLLFVLVQSSVIAQSDSILYRTYEYPNVYRRALQLEPRLRGSYNNFKDQNESDPEISSSFDQDLRLSFSTFKNNEKTQGESYGSFSNSYSKSKSNELKEVNYGFYMNMNNLQRKFNARNHFFEWGYRLNSSYTGYKRAQFPDENRQNLYNTLSVPLKIGKGRIQPITDVFLAKFIADELVSTGIISRQMTQSELFSFANEIAILQNKRVFDNRRYRVYVQENLSKWLENNFQTDKERTIELVNIITDNWLNAFLTNRLSGKSFSFGVTPSIQFNRDLEDGTYRSIELATSGEVEYKNELPISQFFQRSINISAGLTTVEKSYEEISDNFLEPFFNASYVLGYYPNSRTSLSLSANVNYLRYNNVIVGPKDYDRIDTEIYFRTSYFINNRVRIFGSLSAYYTYSHRDDVEVVGTIFQYTYNEIGLNSNIGLSYIFY
jgi:hypothetical protein